MEKCNDIIAALPPHLLVVGCRQVERELSKGTLRCVYVAKDNDAKTTKRLKNLLKNTTVDQKLATSRAMLGAAVGIEVGCSVVGVKKA